MKSKNGEIAKIYRPHQDRLIPKIWNVARGLYSAVDPSQKVKIVLKHTVVPVARTFGGETGAQAAQLGVEAFSVYANPVGWGFSKIAGAIIRPISEKLRNNLPDSFVGGLVDDLITITEDEVISYATDQMNQPVGQTNSVTAQRSSVRQSHTSPRVIHGPGRVLAHPSANAAPKQSSSSSKRSYVVGSRSNKVQASIGQNSKATKIIHGNSHPRRSKPTARIGLSIQSIKTNSKLKEQRMTRAASKKRSAQLQKIKNPPAAKSSYKKRKIQTAISAPTILTRTRRSSRLSAKIKNTPATKITTLVKTTVPKIKSATRKLALPVRRSRTHSKTHQDRLTISPKKNSMYSRIAKPRFMKSKSGSQSTALRRSPRFLQKRKHMDNEPQQLLKPTIPPMPKAVAKITNRSGNYKRRKVAEPRNSPPSSSLRRSPRFANRLKEQKAEGLTTVSVDNRKVIVKNKNSTVKENKESELLKNSKEKFSRLNQASFFRKMARKRLPSGKKIKGTDAKESMEPNQPLTPIHIPPHRNAEEVMNDGQNLASAQGFPGNINRIANQTAYVLAENRWGLDKSNWDWTLVSNWEGQLYTSIKSEKGDPGKGTQLIISNILNETQAKAVVPSLYQAYSTGQQLTPEFKAQLRELAEQQQMIAVAVTQEVTKMFQDNGFVPLSAVDQQVIHDGVMTALVGPSPDEHIIKVMKPFVETHAPADQWDTAINVGLYKVEQNAQAFAEGRWTATPESEVHSLAREHHASTKFIIHMGEEVKNIVSTVVAGGIKVQANPSQFTAGLLYNPQLITIWENPPPSSSITTLAPLNVSNFMAPAEINLTIPAIEALPKAEAGVTSAEEKSSVSSAPISDNKSYNGLIMTSLNGGLDFLAGINADLMPIVSKNYQLLGIIVNYFGNLIEAKEKGNENPHSFALVHTTTDIAISAVVSKVVPLSAPVILASQIYNEINPIDPAKQAEIFAPPPPNEEFSAMVRRQDLAESERQQNAARAPAIIINTATDLVTTLFDEIKKKNSSHSNASAKDQINAGLFGKKPTVPIQKGNINNKPCVTLSATNRHLN